MVMSETPMSRRQIADPYRTDTANLVQDERLALRCEHRPPVLALGSFYPCIVSVATFALYPTEVNSGTTVDRFNPDLVQVETRSAAPAD